jgi:simple sugar transport system substrate-binding protein
MIRKTKFTALAVAASAALAMTACSSGGGKAADTSSGAAGGGNAAGSANTKVVMITHQAPGDTVWDIIRKGAEAAAKNTGVTLEYTNDPDATKQAQLVQAAIDKKVDGIAVTDPNTGALGDSIKKAVAAGIPVSMFNAGGPDAMGLGAIGYFGQAESDAGLAVGKRLVADGAKNAICVIQEQGQQQLEDRCEGVAKGAGSVKVERIYVDGRNDAAQVTTLQAKFTQDPTIDYVVTLGAPFALNASKAIEAAGSKAKLGTFDTSKDLVTAIKDKKVTWAIDQQPYLQGYLAVESLWLYKTNGNVIGGGQNVPTGPAFIDDKNVEAVAGFAANGTR